MNSNFVETAGLAGLSGVNLTGAQKALFEGSMQTSVIPVVQGDNWYNTLMRGYQREINTHKKYQPNSPTGKMFREKFGNKAGRAYQYAISHYGNYLEQQGVYNPIGQDVTRVPEPEPQPEPQPVPSGSSSQSGGGGGAPTNNGTPQTNGQPPAAKQAGAGGWVAGGLALAALAGGAWYFMSDDEKAKN